MTDGPPALGAYQRPSFELCRSTIEAIVAALSLTELSVLPLTSAMSPHPVGEIRQWTGGPLDSLIYVGIRVPPIGLDSHMMFAFAKSESSRPHFTLDSVQTGEHLAFHLDLRPRAELAVDVPYMDAAFTPLTETFEAGRAVMGLEPAHLTPRQLAIMSPWMLAFRATPEAFAQMGSFVGSYSDHWLSMVTAADEPPCALDAAALRARDLIHRANLFNPDIDKIWPMMDRLLGEEQSAMLQARLRTPLG